MGKIGQGSVDSLGLIGIVVKMRGSLGRGGLKVEEKMRLLGNWKNF